MKERILITIVSWVVIYFMFSFLALAINPVLWTEALRVLYICVIATVGTGILVLPKIKT